MASNYKPTRINLCAPVRAALVSAGISTVKCISALNAALGETKLTGEDSSQGKGQLTKETYKTTVKVSLKFGAARTIPLEFDAWHSAIEKANKIAEFDTVAIPERFANWLSAFKKDVEPVNEPATV